MTDQEILSNAIQKMQDSGLLPADACLYDDVQIEPTHIDLFCRIHKRWDTVFSVDEIVFNKTFAKAFWGEKAQYHLQRMKSHDHPLKYIEKFL
jgi:hypothetical protein